MNIPDDHVEVSLENFQRTMSVTSVRMVEIFMRYPSKPADPPSLKDIRPEDLDFRLERPHSYHLNRRKFKTNRDLN